MRVLTKLRLLVALLVLALMGSTGLAIWAIHNANYNTQRMDLAHKVYQDYLSLNANTYELFKQYGDAFLIEGENLAIETQIEVIQNDIANIRQAIGREIDMVGSEEIEELTALNAIEAKLNRLIYTLGEMSEDAAAEGWSQLSSILNTEIDRNFQAMIDDALEEELTELAEMRSELADELVLYRLMAASFTAIAIISTIATVTLLSQSLSRPLKTLMAGARRIGDGDYAHRIEFSKQDEMTELADSINGLAARVQQTTSDLSRQNEELEGAVQQRTVQLEQLLKEAQQADGRRRRMISDVSHELRTPLTIIQGEAEVALRGGEKTPEEYREALERARDAAAHTARIVDDLLFIARTEAGQPRLKISQSNLNDTIIETLSTFGPRVSFEATVQDGFIGMDALRIKQCLIVLIQNAMNYGGDQIICRLDYGPNGYLLLTIEDNGPGMSDADKTQAFERYFRGSNASQSYSEGMGLGLPLAKSIIEAHGGRMELLDRDQGGLIVAMTLPARPQLSAVS
ncbi:sensor histidine kinase [Pseudaestuariivita rosea]|uniref:sensor histidine kinase n=1 Tax=Pseudaestuariivita rosea TaxID=2763263 RepID=UPI001ABBB913|nr:HAMP domain-containing sensor histidine kinase [Pseudaestuariivita rosea]